MTIYNDIEYSHLTIEMVEELLYICGEEDTLHILGTCNNLLRELEYFDSFDFPKSYENTERDFRKFITAKRNCAEELKQFSKTEIILDFPIHPTVASDNARSMLSNICSDEQIREVMKKLINCDKNRKKLSKAWNQHIIDDFDVIPD